MPLRPYQETAIEQIRGHYAKGKKRVLLHLATGGGKTTIFSHVLKEASLKGTRAIMAVRGRELVEQASQKLFRESVPHGVRMAGHWNKNYSARVQVCSIDTLLSRRDFPEASIIVVDEAHMWTAEGCMKFLNAYPKAYILAVTATPYTQKSLRHLADEIVHPVSVRQLVEQGFLVSPRYYAPSAPDLNGVRIDAKTRDYVSGQLEDRMGTLTGDIVDHWIRLGENRSTVCFAVNIHHSKAIVAQFLSQGIAAEHTDADTTESDHRAIMARLQSGETKVVSNVGILCTGVDLPFLKCIIMARPTQSYNLFIQQAGRGTRPFDGKNDFILLDHAGNVTRHGFIDDEPEVDLDGRVKHRDGSYQSIVRICKKCFMAYSAAYCPECGPDLVVSGGMELPEIDEGELERIRELTLEQKVRRFIEEKKAFAKKKGYSQGWVFHRCQEEFGQQVAEKFMPKRNVPEWVRAEIDRKKAADPFGHSPFKPVGAKR